MHDTRPDRDDPDAPPPRRGRHRIFFGASAGVGKTSAMLAAAQAARAQGTDVLVGVVETHGRGGSAGLPAGLDRLPGAFDLDAVLARRPALVLVDELAHANPDGARHARRWQDVEALLDAGIDVWSTLNVQHLETLGDVVEGITGVRVRETVPDRVFDRADEVVLVDLPPDELLRRFEAGQVHLPGQAADAVRNFFRKGNLIALRELAQRRTADRGDGDGDGDHGSGRAAPSAPPRREAPARMPGVPLGAAGDAAGGGWTAYAKAAGICAAAAAIAAPLSGVLELSNIVMVFLLAVVVVALRLGRGPAVAAAFLGVAAFDFLFVPPRFSFDVSDVQYLVTFAVMLAVALVVGQLTAVLKWQASVATAREQRVSALYEMSRDLSGALLAQQVAEIASRFLASEFDARAALLVASLEDRVLAPVAAPGAPAAVAAIDLAVAQWVFEHGEPAGQGTGTLPAAPVLYVPLKAPMRLRGVLAVEARDPARLAGPEQRRRLDTCASLLAISLERLHYIEVAQSTTVQVESERLRNSLLAAISHDLRTPLAALVGMAESMTLEDPSAAGAPRRAELAGNIREAASRMNSQVDKLLDMARLQSGRVRLDRQWLPLEEAVGGAVRALAGALDGARVKARLPADLPFLHVDPALFERVLCNLLENAVKYTPPGSPIEIHAAPDGDARVRVVVDDHGPGLPRHKEEAIFEMFERGRKESATPGVGLGLAICRAIVGAHGGTISGETRPGGGARFVVTLPGGLPPAIEGLEAIAGEAP